MTRPKPDNWPEWPPDSTFEERYLATYAPAVAYAYRITRDWQGAQEAVQDAFLQLHDKMEAGENPTSGDFRVIVRRRAIDAFRERQRRRKLGVPESELASEDEAGKVVPFLQNQPCRQPDPAQQVAEEDLIQAMRASLTEDQRVIFDGKLAGRSDAEIAEELGISEEAVKQRWKRIRAILRDRFPNPFRS